MTPGSRSGYWDVGVPPVYDDPRLRWTGIAMGPYGAVFGPGPTCHPAARVVPDTGQHLPVRKSMEWLMRRYEETGL